MNLKQQAAHSTLFTSVHLKKYSRPIEHQYELPTCGTTKSYHLGCHCDACKKAEREYRKTLPKRN